MENELKILRINVRKQMASWDYPSENYRHLGGRGLSARILLDEVNPTCDPCGPNNILVFAPGLLVGHRLSSLGRISIGGKSPLTGGIKEANAGGRTGYHLAQLGIKALIIEDQPVEEKLMVLYISKSHIKFDDGTPSMGMGVYESAPLLIEKYGENVANALIGPGGEMKLKSAGIQNIDKDWMPSRIAARGGLGAVMGSKYIKAIVIDDEGRQKPQIIKEKAFKDVMKEFTTALVNHLQTEIYANYGTASMTNIWYCFGALPTRNFSSGEFEHAEKISGEYMQDLLLKRGGVSETTHTCMSRCAIRCSNVFGDETGKEVIASPVEYETIGLMGSNLGIDSLDTIAKLNWHTNNRVLCGGNPNPV